MLIVDDVPDNLAVLHDALDESGYTVLVATNGEQALQRAAQALPDIVLLDAVMPGMDGFEVARRLKADARDRAHPDRLHDRPDRDRARGAAFQSRRRRLRHQADPAEEVLARIAAHMQGARADARQARNALDAFGHATLAVRAARRHASCGRRRWRASCCVAYEAGDEHRAGESVLDWLQAQAVLQATGGVVQPLTLARHGRRLAFALHEAARRAAARAAATTNGWS